MDKWVEVSKFDFFEKIGNKKVSSVKEGECPHTTFLRFDGSHTGKIVNTDNGAQYFLQQKYRCFDPLSDYDDCVLDSGTSWLPSDCPHAIYGRYNLPENCKYWQPIEDEE